MKQKNLFEIRLRELRKHVVNLEESSDEYIYVSGMISNIKELLGHEKCNNNVSLNNWANTMYR